jgi:lipopolysaccharide transport system ATP-binding protein
MANAIKVENLSKAYQLGDFGTGTISRDLARSWARIRGKEDPFLKIGEVNDRSTKGESDIVWALKNLNFEITQGDAVGVIGRNGAGKSTLLKILSRVTSPTTGSIKVKGRIASLLEVGTGFHPELTGRENTFLNGAILGMRKAEIKRKFDQIVQFAGVERYIDTPIKRYSSGMYVRLAFAVAAYLESEILIVDEVLAVGDAEFQKKCLGKMSDVSKGEGRTILFVSHNMGSIQSLCKKAMLLTKGQIGIIDDSAVVVNKYLSNQSTLQNDYHRYGNQKIYLQSFDLCNADGSAANTYLLSDPAILKLLIGFKENAHHIEIGINIKNIYDELISHITNLDKNIIISGKKDEIKAIEITINSLIYTPGQYKLDIFIIEYGTITDANMECLYFNIENSDKSTRPGGFPSHAKVFTDTVWKV